MLMVRAKEKDKAKDYLLYRVALCWAAEWWSAGGGPVLDVEWNRNGKRNRKRNRNRKSNRNRNQINKHTADTP